MSTSSSSSSVAANQAKFSDVGFSWFKLVFSIVYMGFGTFCLVVFFRARHVFEIRARSAYLVTTLGLLLLVYQGLSVDLHAIVLFGAHSNYFHNNLILFFVTFAIAGCYISRVIRLAVGFSPNIRRSLPWLASEKLLVAASLSLGVISLIIPLYYYFTIDGKNYPTKFRKAQEINIWTCTLVLQVLELCLLPVVWMIDDLFQISRELIVIIVVGAIQTVFVKLFMSGYLEGKDMEKYINAPNLQLVATSILFGLSVIDPVRRLMFSPMAQTSAAMARAAARSAAARQRKQRRGNTSRSRDQVSMSRGDSASSQHMWNYEKIAANPAMAEAFRLFANRALCQESVWFLEEVSRYQKEDYTIASPLGSGQIAAFEAITKRFIADGAPDEVSLCSREKKGILNLYIKPNDPFDDEEELSGAFNDAYKEIRYMIESNILHKFTETDEFHKAVNKRPINRRKQGLLFAC